VTDNELKYGLAVTGVVDPGKVVSNAGAKEGDLLVLTKPVGTGVMTTALNNEARDDEGLARVTDVMLKLNRAASVAMVEAGASAATDVTGFGLVGHSLGMGEASGVTLEIEVERVPLIDGALETLRAGYRPGGLFSNQQYYRPRVHLKSRADAYTLELMNDPQTSGGLLITIAEERFDALVDACERHGEPVHEVIGRVLPKTEKPVALV
jgi:selenide,water dikinase